jgi:hypothetical protein
VRHGNQANAGKWSAPSIARVLSERTGIVIEVCELTRRYGAKTAVDDLTFAVQPGIVMGFPGSAARGSPRRGEVHDYAGWPSGLMPKFWESPSANGITATGAIVNTCGLIRS